MQLTKTSLDSVRWRLLYAITAWAGIATLLLATSWGDEHRNRLIWAVSDSLGLAIWALLGVALYPVLAAPWSRRGAWARRVPLLLLAWLCGSLAGHMVEVVVDVIWLDLQTGQCGVACSILRRFTHWGLLPVLFLHLPGFVGLLALCTIVVLLDRSRQRKASHAVLMAELADARLTNLRAQLQPHFLFNTLNTAASLAGTDSRAAIELLSELSSLLRRASSAGDSHFATIAEEVAFLRSYIAIMQYRFGDRIVVDVHVDKGIESGLIPVLTLQPLVENAYVHGPGASPSGGRIRVSLVRSGQRIKLSVTDELAGAPGVSVTSGQGVALENLEARLSHLYGAEDASLQTTSKGDAGFIATVEVPFVSSEEEISP